MAAREEGSGSGRPTPARGRRLKRLGAALGRDFHGALEVPSYAVHDVTFDWSKASPYLSLFPGLCETESYESASSEVFPYEWGTFTHPPETFIPQYSCPGSYMGHPLRGAPLPVHLNLLDHPSLAPNGPELAAEDPCMEEASQTVLNGAPRSRPLARTLLCPVPPDLHKDLGGRRRGRPPGSGNRRRMSPPKVGRDGVRGFKSRSANFTGVYMTSRGKWRAQFSHQSKVVQLGMYSDEQAAGHRWDIEAIRLRGPSTQLNFPELASVYLELLGKVLRSTEGREMDLSNLFSEELIQREIQDRVAGYTNGIEIGAQQESEPSSGHSSLAPIVDASTMHLYAQIPLDGISTLGGHTNAHQVPTPVPMASPHPSAGYRPIAKGKRKGKRSSKSTRPAAEGLLSKFQDVLDEPCA